MTVRNIQSIFYSGNHSFNGDQESIGEIDFLVEEKYLNLEKIIVGKKVNYLTFLDKLAANEHKYNRAAGGSKNHMALKLLAADYLKSRGFRAIQYEHPFCGYYPDVMDKGARIVIECGHTQNPEKILKYFQYGAVRECIQIPYPTCEEDLIPGYLFSPGNELNEFLAFLESEKVNELKKLAER